MYPCRLVGIELADKVPLRHFGWFFDLLGKEIKGSPGVVGLWAIFGQPDIFEHLVGYGQTHDPVVVG